MEHISPIVIRRTLVNELKGGRVEDLGASFDLSAFPLPMRVGPWKATSGLCWTCTGKALQVWMKVTPRGTNELPGVVRDEHGAVELCTCTHVNQYSLDQEGPERAIERIREAIRNMAMHEVYECILFRGERIFDPHEGNLRPDDQPF